MTRALPSAFLATSALLVAGCHGSGEVVIGIPADPVYSESEPNDDAWDADAFGFLDAGEHLCIAGSVRDDPYDPQDGFEFVATQSLVVDFVLEPQCDCADLDLWIYDPWLDQFVGVFDSPFGTERGSFVVHGQPFHLVVVSASGDAPYRLDVRASGYHPLTAGAATGDARGIRVEVAPHGQTSGKVPAAVPDSYRGGERATAPAELVTVYVLDPERGVVATGALALAPGR